MDRSQEISFSVLLLRGVIKWQLRQQNLEVREFRHDI